MLLFLFKYLNFATYICGRYGKAIFDEIGIFFSIYIGYLQAKRFSGQVKYNGIDNVEQLQL